MSYFTVKHIRALLEGLPDDEPVYGSLMFRTEQPVDDRDESGDIVREPTPEEWVAIVDKAESLSENQYGPWAMMWECLNNAKNEVCPEPEDEDEEEGE